MNISHNLLKVKYFIDYFNVKIKLLEAHLLTHIFQRLTHILQLNYGQTLYKTVFKEFLSGGGGEIVKF